MSKNILITVPKILEQVKLSCQLPPFIEAVARREILKALARDLSIVIDKEELQNQADKIRLNLNLYKPEETVAWLERYYLSVEDFEEIARQQILVDKLSKQLFSEQVEAFYVNNLADLIQAEISEISFSEYDLAMEIFYALQEGEISFIQAAQQYIEDKKLQRQSGYRGWLNRRQLLPEISAAVFEAHSPQILKPLVTSQGVHLILVSEILQPPLDESLRQKILSDLFNNWLSQQVAEANIIQQLNLDSSVITLPVGQTG